MKLCMTVFNKPHIITAFYMEAAKMADWFQCRLKVQYADTSKDWLDASGILPVGFGPSMELEITVEGDGSEEVLEMIRYLMKRQFCEARFSGN
jgi:phosphotransferase system HPr-like phosphotransfer protein